MASAIRDKALVVIQLSGGNDCLNTVVPYTNGLYYDFRIAPTPFEQLAQVSQALDTQQLTA